MRNYQRRKDNPYLLPHNVYVQMLYVIRDYERLKKDTEDALAPSAVLPGCMPHAPQAVSSTEKIAEKFEQALAELRAVENAIDNIPEFYRKPVLNNICFGARYPLGADERTFRKYKQRLVYYVAKNLKKI